MIYICREREEKQSKIYKTNSMVEESQKNEKGVPKEEDLDQARVLLCPKKSSKEILKTVVFFN